MAGLRPARSLERRLLTSWHGTAYCHVPADEPLRLERLVTSDGSDDRWNGPGEPTLYLALDLGTALGELARHLELDPDTATWRRRLMALSVEVDGLIDLRREDVRASIGVHEEPAAFRDVDVARDIAGALRDDDGCAGLLVPSMTFLDDPGRGNLVVFMDRFGGVPDIVRQTREAGLVELRPPDGSA